MNASAAKKNPKADAYFTGAKQWPKEMRRLRTIILDCGLTEELKWGKPCYSLAGGNVVLIVPMKETCALMFCKGALLRDAEGLLTKPGENTQAVRWMKFTGLPQIAERATVVEAYLREAAEVERAGLDVEYKTTAEYKVPAELEAAWKENPALKTAFEALTPGRQRGYLIFFSAPKQSKTRESRIIKSVERILDRKGLNDR